MGILPKQESLESRRRNCPKVQVLQTEAEVKSVLFYLCRLLVIDIAKECFLILF